MVAALLGPLDYMFGETLNVAITAAIILAVVFAVSGKFNEWSWQRTVRTWLWVTSLVAIWLFTQHSPYKDTGRHLDLSPFNDLRAARISEHRRDLVLANIALFVPFGVAAAWRRYGLVRTAALGLALSVAAETLQYVIGHGRIAQVDDVILNFAGAVIGWTAARSVRQIVTLGSRSV